MTLNRQNFSDPYSVYFFILPSIYPSTQPYVEIVPFVADIVIYIYVAGGLVGWYKVTNFISLFTDTFYIFNTTVHNIVPNQMKNMAIESGWGFHIKICFVLRLWIEKKMLGGADTKTFNVCILYLNGVWHANF